MTFSVNAEEFSAVQMHQNEVKAVLDFRSVISESLGRTWLQTVEILSY